MRRWRRRRSGRPQLPALSVFWWRLPLPLHVGDAIRQRSSPADSSVLHALVSCKFEAPPPILKFLYNALTLQPPHSSTVMLCYPRVVHFTSTYALPPECNMRYFTILSILFGFPIRDPCNLPDSGKIRDGTKLTDSQQESRAER